MDSEIEKTLSSLRARHINGIFAQTSEEASEKILALIPPNAAVGIGDSTTMHQMGILEALRKRGSKILNPFEPKGAETSADEFKKWNVRLRHEATLCDVFLTGTNALTRDGRLVNLDATGNRVAGMFWGHPLSVVIVGRNKIVKDLDEALERIRKVIAPTHFRLRCELGGKKRETPCVATGKCTDCRSVDRGCNVFTIIEGKPTQTNLNVILVNEDLGLGWDPSWPEERIEKIRESYRKSVWIPV
jgi:hypothetical protein